jgi:hypothetical protein
MNPDVIGYFLMMQLSTPHNSDNTAIFPYVNIGTNIRIENLINKDEKMIIQQCIFNRIIEKFGADIKKYPELIKDENLVRQYFSKTLELLIPLNPSNIVFSLTTSNSLHFRIYQKDKEINLEVFYLKYEENDKIEAVLNVYKNGIAIIKDFGTLDDMFNNILYSKNTYIIQNYSSNITKTDSVSFDEYV